MVPADALAYNITSSLIALTKKRPENIAQVESILWQQLSECTQQMTTSSGEQICSALLPALLGILRACQHARKTSVFSEKYIAKMVDVASVLLCDANLARVRDAVVKTVQGSSYAKKVILSYPQEQGPLSGNLLIYAYMRFVQWFLENHLERDNSASVIKLRSLFWKEAEEPSNNVKKALKAGYIMAIQYLSAFRQMQAFIRLNAEEQYAPELYCPEIMAVSLQVAGLCECHLNSNDDQLIQRIKEILEAPPVNTKKFNDCLLYKTAFEVCVLLSQRFLY